jgi:hypothetical protein
MKCVVDEMGDASEGATMMRWAKVVQPLWDAQRELVETKMKLRDAHNALMQPILEKWLIPDLCRVVTTFLE